MLASIAAIAGALTAIIGIVNTILKALKTAPAQTDQNIEAQEQANKEAAENLGRPV